MLYFYGIESSEIDREEQVKTVIDQDTEHRKSQASITEGPTDNGADNEVSWGKHRQNSIFSKENYSKP